MAGFEVRTQVRGEWMTLEALGELDVAAVERFDRELVGWLDRGSSPSAALDLSRLTFMDSSGLRSVLMANFEAARSGRRLVVIPGDGVALRVIELAHVDGFLELRASEVLLG